MKMFLTPYLKFQYQNSHLNTIDFLNKPTKRQKKISQSLLLAENLENLSRKKKE
jgi:hypothetical protein